MSTQITIRTKRIMNEPSGYPTQSAAESKMNRVFAKVEGNESGPAIQWFVSVNASGRFCPAVLLDDTNNHMLTFFAREGVNVIVR